MSESGLTSGLGFIPLGTVIIVSARNNDGSLVLGCKECRSMLPGKWPPAIRAVRPGNMVLREEIRLVDGLGARLSHSWSWVERWSWQEKVETQSGQVV